MWMNPLPATALSRKYLWIKLVLCSSDSEDHNEDEWNEGLWNGFELSHHLNSPDEQSSKSLFFLEHKFAFTVHLLETVN